MDRFVCDVDLNAWLTACSERELFDVQATFLQAVSTRPRGLTLPFALGGRHASLGTCGMGCARDRAWFSYEALHNEQAPPAVIGYPAYETYPYYCNQKPDLTSAELKCCFEQRLLNHSTMTRALWWCRCIITITVEADECEDQDVGGWGH